MEQKQRPIILEIEEARQELIQCVNNILHRGLGCYFIEPMFAEVYRQIKANAQNEVAQAREQFNTIQAENGAE